MFKKPEDLDEKFGTWVGEMSAKDMEDAYQKIIKDSKLGEFLWPAIEEKLESGEIKIENGSIILAAPAKGPVRGFSTDICHYDE